MKLNVQLTYLVDLMGRFLWFILEVLQVHRFWSNPFGTLLLQSHPTSGSLGHSFTSGSHTVSGMVSTWFLLHTAQTTYTFLLISYLYSLNQCFQHFIVRLPRWLQNFKLFIHIFQKFTNSLIQTTLVNLQGSRLSLAVFYWNLPLTLNRDNIKLQIKLFK